MGGNKLYRLEFLPTAQRDMVEIVRYISRVLCNPTAAERLIGEMTAAEDSISRFPYSCPVYIPIKPLKYEYRRLLVRNYLMFYRVDEEKKLVTVARVIYAKRDYAQLLD